MKHALRCAPVLLTTLVLLLTGCSGDGDEQAAAGNEKSSAPPAGEQVERCRAEVSTTGDDEVSWEEKAQVNLRGQSDEGAGPAARYTTKDGKSSLSVYSAGPDFAANLTLEADGTVYSAGEDPKGLEAAEDGSRVEARKVRLEGPDGTVVELNATFDCGSSKA